jgi:hypothetical protein
MSIFRQECRRKEMKVLLRNREGDGLAFCNFERYIVGTEHNNLPPAIPWNVLHDQAASLEPRHVVVEVLLDFVVVERSQRRSGIAGLLRVQCRKRRDEHA